jgi:hypothetical protein
MLQPLGFDIATQCDSKKLCIVLPALSGNCLHQRPGQQYNSRINATDLT